MSIEFVWDIRKAASNLRKHGVGFDEAKEIFFDPHSVSFPDDLHSASEDRLVTIGTSTKLRVLLVVHTETHHFAGGATIRIISARRATRRERAFYE